MKVRIRNLEGHYLAGANPELGFSADSTKALVFDYVGHNIAEQLEIIRQTQGLTLEIEEVDPKEVLETCDTCGKMFSPFGINFDGRRFVCADCETVGFKKPAPSTKPKR
jgi:hypothetical protein